MKKLSWILALAGLALAQVNLSGQLDTNFGVRTSDATVSLGQTTLKIDLGYDLEDAALKATLNFGYDALSGKPSFSLGEAYATVYLNKMDLSVGNQVVSWGRVDYLSPEDVLNPKNLARPLADPSAQKLPVPMVHATIYPDEAGMYQLEAVWIPKFTPSIAPQGAWAPPVSLPSGVTQVETTVPGPDLTNGVFGVRATASFDVLDGLDLGATVIRDYFSFPSAKKIVPVDLNDSTGPQKLILGHDRRTLLGADFALAFSIPDVAEGLVLRGEAAYALTDDPQGKDPFTQNPYAEGVLSLEYTWTDGPQTIVVYDLKWQKADAPAADTFTQRLGLLASYDYNERTRLEGAWLHNLSDGSGLLRPQLVYTFADGVSGNIGFAYFYGPANSEFGVYNQNSEVQLGLSYSF